MLHAASGHLDRDASGQVDATGFSPVISVGGHGVVFVHVDHDGLAMFRAHSDSFWAGNSYQALTTSLSTSNVRIEVTGPEMRISSPYPTKYVVLARTPE
jgi:hypothetical protein